MFVKVFITGKSLVASIIQRIIKLFGILESNDESGEMERKHLKIIIHPIITSNNSSIDEAFVEQVTDFIENYRPALEALAQE